MKKKKHQRQVVYTKRHLYRYIVTYSFQGAHFPQIMKN